MTKARAQFCEVVRLAEAGDVQVLTSNGVEVAVVVSLEAWEELKRAGNSADADGR